MTSDNQLSTYEADIRPQTASDEELASEALRRMNILGVGPDIQRRYSEDGAIAVTRQPIRGVNYVDTLTSEEMQFADHVIDMATYNLLFEDTLTKVSGIIYYAIQTLTIFGDLYAFLSVETDKAQWDGASFGCRTATEGGDIIRYIESLGWTVSSDTSDADLIDDGFFEVGMIGVCAQNGILVRRT